MSAFGGAEGNKVVEPGIGQEKEDMKKGSYRNVLAAKLNRNDESYDSIININVNYSLDSKIRSNVYLNFLAMICC
jgi:hypothetical protein